MNYRLSHVVVLLGTLAACAVGRAAEVASGPATHPYFPLGKGKSWKYSVSWKADDAAPKSYFQTVRSEDAVESAGQVLLAVGDELYAVDAQGVWLAAHREGGKVAPLAQPVKVLPAGMNVGEWWKTLGGTQTTTSTCLGSRAIQNDAGQFESQCVAIVTTDSSRPQWQRQAYRFYARGVGLVRETITEQVAKADGKVSVTQMTRELVAYDDGAHEAPPLPFPPARPLNTEHVRGVLLDPAGKPIAQVPLTILRTDQAQTLIVQTDVVGRFSRDRLDPAGMYMVVARLPGCQAAQMPLHSVDGSAVEVEIRLKPAIKAGTQPSSDASMAIPLFMMIDVVAPAPATTQASPDTLVDEGRALAAKGDHATAVERYREALRSDAARSDARAYLIAGLIALDRLAEAQAQIDEGARLAPSYLFSEMAGLLALTRGQIDRGVALYDEAARLSPQNAGAVWADLAAALAARKDPKLDARIEESLRKAAGAQPPHLDSLFHLGQSYASAGKQEGRPFLVRYLDESAKLADDKRDKAKTQLAKQLIRALDMLRDAGGQ